MTLRSRLVLALVLLATAGLVVFGVSTYGLYSRAQYDRLDDQLRNTRDVVTQALFEKLGIAPPIPGGGGRRGTFVPPGSWAALYDASGNELATLPLSSGDSVPAVPAVTSTIPRGGSFATVGASSGSGEWRVFLTRTSQFGDITTYVAIAIPTTEVTDALDRLVLIEAFAGAALLGLLGLGSWLVVRHGLRPLEKMADSAGTISAGELHQRVAPADTRSEVGQLGLALNTMLEKLEVAFAERDATERKLRQFLADASHELRTPLTSIQGFAELFRLGAAGNPEELAIILRRIEEESARMKTLVDDLLMLARIDQARPIERVEVDLGVLAADACTDTRVVARDRPVTLDAPAPVIVVGDEHHLRQAIANLMTNAVKHTPAGTAIDVGVSAAGGRARVTVRDHGDGLDDDALAHVFDRFWQADAARVGTGAGLGLSIVDGIVRQHGGQVTAANAPGGGAVFTIDLPLAPTTDASGPTDPTGPTMDAPTPIAAA